jgi:N-acetylmuramoyl-L-alanine amidase
MSPSRSAICLLLPLLAAATAAPAAEITGLRLLDDAGGTRAVLELQGGADFKLFTLHDPERVVLDLPKARLSPGLRLPGPNGAVASLRTGHPDPDTLRLVFDLARPVHADSRVEREGNDARLTLSLGGPGQLAAGEPAPAPVAAPAPSIEAAVEPPAIEAPVAAPIAAAHLQPQAPSRPTAPAPRAAKTLRDVVGDGQRKLVVAIDAGHGGKDPGALGPSGVREKNVTLATARELARQINADPGMRAVLIRDGDVFVPLKQRYMKARAAQADLFISIHADAAQNDAANGASVFVLSTRGASSQAARWLADQENAADLVGGVSLDEKDRNLAAVLLDLSQSATMRASDDIAGEVLGALKSVGKAHKPAIERANFVVLRSPDVPSMLVETGFITNRGEEQKLNDPAYRGRLAAAIASGVRKYFAEQAPPGTWYAVRRGDTGAGLAGGLMAGTPE